MINNGFIITHYVPTQLGDVIATGFRGRREAGQWRGSMLLLIWSIRHWQRAIKQIKTWIEELKRFVFQSSEQVRSWLGPVKDEGRSGGWDWKERCSGEHVCRDVPASVMPQSRQHCTRMIVGYYKFVGADTICSHLLSHNNQQVLTWLLSPPHS